jgi:Asp-tRNA(Asn)/Glu-tRNA(Gln) amidotransferase A subunit family amidase
LAINGGLTPTGLSVGLELDGRLGSKAQLLGIAMAFESVLGRLHAPVL